ncbi:MAG: zinc-dependent metalloprotease [Planctomycetota bacterium]|jgi:hypothetical protein
MQRTLLLVIPLLAILGSQGRAQESFASATAGTDRQEGFVDFYWDQDEGRILMELPPLGEELLYVASLATGLGSNPVGLDRGQLGPQRVVVFERVGPKIMLVARNYQFRAESDNPMEREAVAASFAPSTLWGFTLLGEDGDRLLVDATEFLLRDAHGVIPSLGGTGQGEYRLDASRSAIYPPRCKAFPDNTEFEASLTFTSSRPGGLVSQTIPDGGFMTLRQHHSFIRLPDDGYQPREYDPRVGFGSMSFRDYATPIQEPIVKRWIRRHRLQKKDPSAALSEAVEPIVYYLDRGAPEPVRSALLEGAAWWNAAFTSAGFKDAFRVEVLPADADPMDVRYNIIHWVHRSTRGWSYGGSIADPRTGEILKGNVLLGSLRVRQDHLIFSGMGANPLTAAACAAGDSPDANYLLPAADQEGALSISLARIRQLSAHEVGHAIGLSHNFAASTYADRASVMDYPAPLITVNENGELDMSRAYGVGVGAYDHWAIRWGYGEAAPNSSEADMLAEVISQGIQAGIPYITDQDARAVDTSHPLASLWDNGEDPLAMLQSEYRVREIGLENFGSKMLREAEPMALLEESLVPLYLHHRYQLEAAAKLIGGLHFSYAVKGDGQEPPRAVSASRQLSAIRLLSSSLSPSFLALPEGVLELIPPHPPGYSGGEIFGGDHGYGLDPQALAQTSVRVTLDAMLAPSRAARMQIQAARNPGLPGFDRLLAELVDEVFGSEASLEPMAAEIQAGVQQMLVDQLIAFADAAGVRADLRGQALFALQSISSLLAEEEPSRSGESLRLGLLRSIDSFLQNPQARVQASRTMPTPAGSPIGSGRGR